MPKKTAIALALLAAACVAPPEPASTVTAITPDQCDGPAFEALGMEDGMNGLGPEVRGARIAACLAMGAKPDARRYSAAYDLGAARYCSIENAWRLGKNGVAVLRECPPDLRKGFEDSYAHGLVMRDRVAPLPHVGIGVGAGPSGERWRLAPGLLF